MSERASTIAGHIAPSPASGAVNVTVNEGQGTVSFSINLGHAQGPSPAATGPSVAAAEASVAADEVDPVPRVVGGYEAMAKENNPCSLKPMGVPVAGTTEGPMCGGTAGVLPAERKKATFDLETMINAIDGGPEKTKRRRFIISPSEGTDASNKFYMSRMESLKEHTKHFIQVHEDYWGKIIPSREDVAWMVEYSMNSGSLMNHYGLFLPTLIGQCSEDQMGEWAPRALMMGIVGSYAQTELGHGSNVRGLRTQATYDKATQEFIISTPTLQSMKWWPGALGKTGTHALVYAQLILDGKEHGVHIFMVQIRDDKHRPIPGVEVGDVGPKMGDAANDTGFLRLDNVRIPREHMLMKYQQVTEDGKYIKEETAHNSKAHYATMMQTRGVMVRGAGGQLARAATIATRYSCVRRQGFLDTAANVPHQSEERQIIDYSVQRYRVFKQLAHAYAFKFSGKWMIDKFSEMEAGQGTAVIGNFDALPEIAATSAGLKGLCTFLTAQGIEDCRKCCGGNGYLLNSGIAAQAADYLWQTTAEGDWVVMILQTARFLLKSLDSAKKGGPVVGPCAYMQATQQKGFTLEKARPPSSKDPKALLDFSYLLKLFQYRALVAVVTVSDDFDAQRKSGKSWDEAWNAVALELFDAVVWHCHSFVLDNFIQMVTKVADPACRAALADVCVLYALSNIVDGQWAGVLDQRQLTEVRMAVRSVMERIRPNCVALVDAFDIPDRVLNSTLGRFDGNVYEALYDAAKKNPLNHSDPYDGYEYSRKHLDMEVIEAGNKPISML